MSDQPKPRNQWAEINDPRSREGIDAIWAVASNVKPLPGILMGQVQSKSSLVLTERLHCITINKALKEFASIAPDLYDKVVRFYEAQDLVDGEWAVAKEIVRILMASRVGQDFYIPRRLLLNDEYKKAHITRLSGTSPYEL